MKKIISIILATAMIFVSIVNVLAFDGGYFIPYKNQKTNNVTEWFKEATSDIELKAYEDLSKYEQRYYFFFLILKMLENSGKEISTDGVTLDFEDVDTILKEDQEGAKVLKQLGILNGRPTKDGFAMQMGQVITRAEVAKVIATFHRENYSAKSVRTCKFSDISGHWAEHDISYLYERGIVKGENAHIFAPDNPITKEEVIAIILNLGSIGNIEIQDIGRILNQVYCVTTKYDNKEESKKVVAVKEVTPEENYYTVKKDNDVEVIVNYNLSKNLKVSNMNGNIAIKDQSINDNGIAKIIVSGKETGAGILKIEYTSGYEEPAYIPIFVYSDRNHFSAIRSINLNGINTIYMNANEYRNLLEMRSEKSVSDNVYFLSEDEEVATVDFATGLLNAKKEGTTNILILSDGLLESIKLVVSKEAKKEKMERIYFQENYKEITEGMKFDLKDFYVKIPLNIEKVEYVSSNPNIVSVDSDGIITALSCGSTKIKVSVGFIAEEINITVIDGVTDIPKQNLKFYSKDMEFKRGMELKIYSILGNSKGKKITFTLSDSNIAILQDSKVIANAVGETVLTAIDEESGNTASLLVRVTE